MKRLVALLLLLLSLPAQTLAYSNEDTNAVINDSIFYLPNESDCSTPGQIVTVLDGSDNVQSAFNYFIQHRLTANQSAGIVGNFMQESNVNPKDPNPSAPNGQGDGIAQWQDSRDSATGKIIPGRWSGPNGLLAFAKKNNKPWDDLGLQLDFVWYELLNSRNYALTHLKATTTVEQAAETFEEDYEGASDPRIPNRINYARQILTQYAGQGDDSAAGTSCPTTGDSTKFVDGFAIYSQFDPAWADKPYGPVDIATAGCGPSAMAMIITALTGVKTTPIATAAYADKQGIPDPKTGASSWSIAPVLAKNWNLKATPIGADMPKITSTLQAGGLVITAADGPLPFTSGGHFIVIRGITIDGKWKIGDSGHATTSTKDWNPQDILADIVISKHQGSVYAITK